MYRQITKKMAFITESAPHPAHFILKMAGACSSKTSVSAHRTTVSLQEGHCLNNHYCEILKIYAKYTLERDVRSSQNIKTIKLISNVYYMYNL
jgi:hypothetical protein